MTAAVVEIAGVTAVAGVVVGQGIGANHQINGGKAAVGRDIIQISRPAAQLHSRLYMPDIKIGAGGAHRTERAGCDDIYFSRGALDAFLFNDTDDLFGGDHHNLPGAYLLVDFLDCSGHGFIPSIVFSRAKT
jgi:hypothetical protein